MSGIVSITSSTADLFTCNELKTWLKVDEDVTEDNELIQGLLATAITRYEEYTQRVPLKTAFRYAQCAFPCGALTLPRIPLVSVSAIRGLTDTDATDTGGTAMSSSDYYLDTVSVPGRVVPVGGGTYPTATRVANAAIVEFVAGYSSGSSGVPDDVKTTIQAMVARAYEHRGDELAMEHAMLDVIGTEAVVSQDWG